MSDFLKTVGKANKQNKKNKKKVDSKKASLKKSELISAELVELYCGAVPKLEVPEKRRVATALLIEEIYIGSLRNHKTIVGAFAISRDEFESRLKCRDYIKCFKDAVLVECANGHYLMADGVCKGWALAEEVQKSLDERLLDYSEQEKSTVCLSYIGLGSYKHNHISNIVQPGINRYVPVNYESMLAGLDELSGWVNYYACDSSIPKKKNSTIKKIWKDEKRKIWIGSPDLSPDDVEFVEEKKSPSERMEVKLRRELAALVALVDQCELSDISGTIPHRFEQKPFGRFYAVGGLSGHRRIGLHHVSRLVRNFAFEGYYSIDINTFNHSLALQVAARHARSRVALRQYVLNRDAERSRLAKIANASIEQVKVFITALAYGAVTPDIGIAFSSWRDAREIGKPCKFQLLNIVDPCQYRLLMGDELVQALADELHNVFEIVRNEVFRQSKNKGWYRNPAGLKVPVSNKYQDSRSLVSSYFQGTEAQILQVLIKEFEMPIFPIHDCVVCGRRENVDVAFQRVFEMTGYRFSADIDLVVSD
jgi:hypothetical protein